MRKNDRDIQSEGRRLLILQLLAADPDYSINDAMLQDLCAMRGCGVALSVLRADLAWLEALGLLTTQELPGCMVALLRNDGLDCARGTATVPGIARPRPE